jgi:hypothetical protein
VLRQIVKVWMFILTTLVNESVIKEGDSACQSGVVIRKRGCDQGCDVIRSPWPPSGGEGLGQGLHVTNNVTLPLT